MSLVKRRWLLAAGILVVLGIGNYLIYTRLLQPRTAGLTAYLTGKVVVMQGESMLPTYREGDRITFRTYRPESGSPQRGEVILYAEPSNQGRLNVKRVIGIGGDRVSVSKGTVYRNGKPLDEPYVQKGATYADTPELTVPAGTVWVLGDNRGRSLDSRMIGAIPLENVRGIAMK